MENTNETKELLDELEILILNNEDDFDKGSGKYILRDFIKSKSLALGKPEPLAKNKQTEKSCSHIWVDDCCPVYGPQKRCTKCGCTD